MADARAVIAEQPALPAAGLPLTPGQAAIWFGQCTRPGSALYQCGELLTFTGPIDPDLLQRVIDACLQAVPVLRARFGTDSDGAPRMLPGPRPAPVRRAAPAPGQRPEAWAADAVRVPAMRSREAALAGDELTGHTLLALPDGSWAWFARFHHILGDGYAIHAFLRWTAACYTAAASGEPAPPSPFLDPAEVLARHEAYADSEAAVADRRFWDAAELRPDPAGLSPRPAAPGDDLIIAEAAVAPETRRRLRDLARRHGADEPELIAAATAHYTAVMSGGDAAVLGMPLMNRPMGERRLAMDPAVNVLPLALGSGIGVPLAEHLEAATARLRELREHGRYRAEQLRRDRRITDPDRRLCGPGLNLKPFASRFRFGSATAALTTVAIGPIDDLDLLFQAEPDGGFRLRLFANGAAHTQRDVAAHAERFSAFLDRVAAAPDTSTLGTVEIALPEERRQVIDAFNDTAHPLTVPEGATLTSLLRARRAADLADPERAAAPALAFGGRTLDRAALWRQTDALAARLRDLGAGPGMVVAVQLRRGPALPIALAAIVSCGAAWVPLDPDLPEARRAFMAATAAPTVLVSGALPAPLGAEELPLLSLDEQSMSPMDEYDPPEAEPVPTAPLLRLDERTMSSADEIVAAAGRPTAETAQTAGPPEAEPAPSETAYLLFTSGSTGVPKGAAVPHAAIVNRLDWMAAHYDLGERDTILQKTPCSFDVSVWEFMLPFTHGPRLAVAADGAHRDPAALAAELRDAAVTACHFVPSALKAFLDGSGVRGSADLPDLRQVFASGEALEAGLAHRCTRTLGVALHNLYGPTEAAVDVTAHTCALGESEIPIGAPVWNTRTYVLDAALRPVPVGVAGQLFLAGVQLALGYAGRPDLTAERFVPDPFHPGERMYATGDIVRWRADGELIYLGRADSQLKLRGQRIEPGEIEARLAEHPAVAQCAVLAREIAGERALVGYLVPTFGASDCTADHALPKSLEHAIRAHLERTLPGYMVPAALLAVAALPTTANGKLDAARLPLPARGTGEFTAPRTPLEAAVQRVFAAALDLPRVSAAANFFEEGGNSLTAVRLAHDLGRETGADVGIADVFAAPSVRAMAERIGRGGEGATDPFAPLLTLREHRDGTPVFCFHPAGGLGWAYAGLLLHLERGRGVFAVQSRGLREPGERAATLAEAAARAATDIEAAATGEVDLVGWSVGGVIAQETAVVLRERGVAVRRLCLMDAYPAELWRDRPAPTAEERLRGLLTMAGIDALGAEPASLASVVAAIRATGSPFGSLPEDVLGGVAAMVGHNAKLMREHRTRAWPGRADFFKAARNPEALDERAWSPHLGELDVFDLPCTHPGMVAAESLARVAEALREPRRP